MVEDRRNVVEPLEAMEDITLVTGDNKKTTKIGTTLSKEIRGELIEFLRASADVFAWSHEDMSGITRDVMAHKLNVNPSMYPMKQKWRVFAPKRNAAMMEEVAVGFIREVYYPEWSRSPVQNGGCVLTSPI